VITESWHAGTKISPAAPVIVSVASGRLTAVTFTSATGKVVAGTIAADGSTWKSTEDLGYGKTYKLVANAVNPDGVTAQQKSSVTTVSPNNLTMPYLQRLGGYTLENGATYGVAIVPVVHFDEPITNKAAAQKALLVTTTPSVAGAWYWTDNQNAHYRPQGYWPAGTKVTVTAKVYGQNLGSGLYGEADKSLSFTIGRKQVTVATDTAPASVNKVLVYNAAGTVIKSMNTSMGKHSGVEVGGNWINFYTLDGTYTVLAHEQPARMCSASYGLPADGPGGYPCESIYNATKISTDGIYLHQLNTTVYAQDHGDDVSHGCLNLNKDNSAWFYAHSIIGDPVVIHGAKGAPKLAEWEGGDWSIPWSTWSKGGIS
jgi:lipoprotein-anchoring transpeptidase ErfK/SrfK